MSVGSTVLLIVQLAVFETPNASEMMFPGMNSVNRLGDMLTSPCVNVCVNEFAASGYWCLS